MCFPFSLGKHTVICRKINLFQFAGLLWAKLAAYASNIRGNFVSNCE